MDINLIPLDARFVCGRTGAVYPLLARTDREQVRRHAASFDLFDAKGREIGHSYAIDREYHVVSAEGRIIGKPEYLDVMLEDSFIVYPQGLRDGVRFGATPVAAHKRFKSLAEAEAYAKQTVERSAKAAIKKASA